MNDEEIKSNIREFLKNCQLTVIATVDVENNKPECAVIAFAEKDDLSLVFGTSNKTRKYKNLQKNQNVSFVFGWSSETGTLQYEGIAKELSDKDAIQHGEMMVLKNNQTEKFITREDQRYFLVKPTWIRLVDASLESGGTYELHL